MRRRVDLVRTDVSEERIAVCSHLLTLVPRSRILLPWRWRWYVLPKRRFTQHLHGTTSQMTAFFTSIYIYAIYKRFYEISRLGKLLSCRIYERNRISTWCVRSYRQCTYRTRLSGKINFASWRWIRSKNKWPATGSCSTTCCQLQSKGGRTPTASRQASRHEIKAALVLHSRFRLESAHRSSTCLRLITSSLVDDMTSCR
jgi:hypothetical protein